MCPYGGALVGGDGAAWHTAELVAHCLLVESSAGLVLVDTGFGTADVADPRRLGYRPFRAAIGLRVAREATATARIIALGRDPADVRHIVVTHLDLDHAGGLGDFPEAEVHVYADEHAVAMDPTRRERARYIQRHWKHGPRWAIHGPGGDHWFGLESVPTIPGLDEEIALIPLPGHSRGHCGVALRDGDRWLLHCGDSYFHHAEIETPPSCPPALRLFQNVVGLDRRARLANQERLRQLRRDHGGQVEMFCSHDPSDLARLSGA